jgi:hypothetical protein
MELCSKLHLPAYLTTCVLKWSPSSVEAAPPTRLPYPPPGSCCCADFRALHHSPAGFPSSSWLIPHPISEPSVARPDFRALRGPSHPPPSRLPAEMKNTEFLQRRELAVQHSDCSYKSL